ncbi:MAG: 5-bromo-4-chloroindolyl phosphate hydrolysis family protein [Clostridiales Family XIII bacterium]|nr:5-bromo-4-chloroindolyl phosphate hydrolysis family protein [Clostridiales Family XIII bacterium]
MTKLALGIVGVVAFGIATIVCAGVSGFTDSDAAVNVGAACLLAWVVFLVVLIVGAFEWRLLQRLGRYSALLSDKANVLRIEDLAAQAGVSAARVRRDMKVLQDKRLHFDIYMDARQTSVLKGAEAYKQYLETERRRAEQMQEEEARKQRMNDPATAPLETFRAECGAAIEKIRAANILLPGAEISARLSKLETTMKRIFAQIEKQPERLPETRRLMNYHLPTTLKLVEKYCQYDGLEFQPDNVKKAKQEIETALDTADLAFTNLLEQLFHEDTLDVTTDAEVLKQMLEQEGLTGRFAEKGENR